MKFTHQRKEVATSYEENTFILDKDLYSHLLSILVQYNKKKGYVVDGMKLQRIELVPNMNIPIRGDVEVEND